MKRIDISLENLDDVFSEHFSEEDISRAKTFFYKLLAHEAHSFYNGKIQSIPKAGLYGFNWFNVWYTPGVSAVSTTIRDNNLTSYELTNRGNFVAIVSDSTRVLGDGDCSPAGGLGVMEGKAFLMKYLGGIDAVPVCIDSRDSKGNKSPDRIIDFVKMIQPSFGAVNLEDISQPNCYKTLDVLREECEIPVWHDDAQGTACVTLAALINSLKLVNKKLEDIKIVLIGAGASNTTIARFIMIAGGNPHNIIIFDSQSSLNKDRYDIEKDKRFYRKWDLCTETNQSNIKDIEKAVEGADVLIALSTPGPDTVNPEWIRKMADKAIVFACANPVPEIYPYVAKNAGAYIVATGRGDFPNQVNNSVGFPGILKGALMVRASKITDNMAIAAAHSIADFAEKRGISPDNITARMDETEVFYNEARDVAMQAIKDGVARVDMNEEEAYNIAKEDITNAREITHSLMNQNLIKRPPKEMLDNILQQTIASIKNSR